MAVAPRSIDPSGIAPVTDPSVVGGAADASPTTIGAAIPEATWVHTMSENVRRALEANQRDPGVIPGLRSDRPATDAEDQAAMVLLVKVVVVERGGKPNPFANRTRDPTWETGATHRWRRQEQRSAPSTNTS